MSPRPVPLTATVLLTAASSSLFLAGCGGGGGGGIYTTSTPGPAAPVPEPAPLPDSDDVTDVTTTPNTDERPQSKCCWSAWGSHYDCGNYPDSPSGGLCNNDITKACDRISNCSGLAAPVTTPPPTTTRPPRTTTTTTTLPEGACRMTQTHGCMNGESFAFADKFVCGKDGNMGLHRWGSNACCARGLVYNPRDKFCCNGALNDFSEGQCHEFDPHNDPVGCRCSTTEETEVTEVVGAEDTVIIDTQDWRTPAENPCMFAEGTMGCMNGFVFDPSSDTLCGQYIVKGETHGCCPTHDGIKVYNLQTESCCQFGNDGDVRPHQHVCQCRQWRGPHCAGLSFLSTVTV